MNFVVKIRLSVMMVLQFFAAGVVVPILSLYLKEILHFNGFQTGIIISMSSVAAFISPLVTSFIADKIISAERLYAICHLFGALIMGLLAYQVNYYIVLVLYLGYSLIIGPTFALINAIIFHNSHGENGRNFGFLRLWGTIGWILAAWLFSFFWLRTGVNSVVSERIPDALKLSAISTGILCIFSLTFPKIKARAKSTNFIPMESINIILKKEILLLMFIGFFINMVERYFYYGAAPFLRSIGFPDKTLMPAMSLGQISEVFAMIISGFLIKKIGYKKVMIVGLITELLRFIALFSGYPVFFVLGGIFFHGFAYTFCFVPLIIFLDNHCNKETRTGAHQLSTIFTGGLGTLVGNIMAGIIIDLVSSKGIVNYKLFWIVPVIITLIIIIILTVFFKESKKEREIIEEEKIFIEKSIK